MSEPNETIPDYKIAVQELETWWNESGLSCEIAGPTPGVDNVGTDHEWPHLAYVLSIRGKSFDYRMGIGHVDWKKAAAQPMRHGLYGTDGSFAAMVAAGKTPHNRQMTAEIACRIAKAQKVVPKPWEVLASAARDGEALLQTFEDWAGEFGYDTDSREAERTYGACCENGRKVIALIGHDEMQKLADLASRL